MKYILYYVLIIICFANYNASAAGKPTGNAKKQKKAAIYSFLSRANNGINNDPTLNGGNQCQVISSKEVDSTQIFVKGTTKGQSYLQIKRDSIVTYYWYYVDTNAVNKIDTGNLDSIGRKIANRIVKQSDSNSYLHRMNKEFLQTTTTKIYQDHLTVQKCSQFIRAYVVIKNTIIVLYSAINVPTIQQPMVFNNDTVVLHSNFPANRPTFTCSVVYDTTICVGDKILLSNIKYAFGSLRGIIGFGGGPSFAYRQLLIQNTEFSSNTTYNARKGNELITAGSAANLYVGLAKYGHYLCMDMFYLKQGFRSKTNTMIDWGTGLYSNSTRTSHIYIQKSLGIGIEYSYRAFNKKKVEPVFTGGLYYVHKFCEGDVGGPEDNGGFKVGVGISYKPNYLFEFRLQPVIYYNFGLDNGTEISTRLYNLGIELSVLLNSKCKASIK